MFNGLGRAEMFRDAGLILFRRYFWIRSNQLKFWCSSGSVEIVATDFVRQHLGQCRLFLTSRVRRHGNLIKPDALPVASSYTFVADVAGEIARQLESERSFSSSTQQGCSELGGPSGKPVETRRECRNMHAEGRLQSHFGMLCAFQKL
jgi:hypothetical protein